LGANLAFPCERGFQFYGINSKETEETAGAVQVRTMHHCGDAAVSREEDEVPPFFLSFDDIRAGRPLAVHLVEGEGGRKFTILVVSRVVILSRLFVLGDTALR
jgi:hypothetical protein